RRAGREDSANCLAESAVEFTVKRGSPNDFRMRGLPLSVTPKAFGANAGSKARKIAKEKRPSEQRFSITFRIGSHSEIAWIAAKVYFTTGEVERENQASASVLPLRIDRSIAFADRDPAIFASGNSRALIRFLEPRDNPRGFRTAPCSCLVAIWKRAVKRILPGREFYRNVITPARGIWVIKTTVVFGPIFVPGTCPIRDRIISARLLADPKDRCHDTFLPWKTLARLRRSRRSPSWRKGNGVDLE